MIKCAKCNISVTERPFIRMNPKGEYGIWWCETCAKTYEPELYKNEKDDESPVERDLKSWAYPNYKKS